MDRGPGGGGEGETVPIFVALEDIPTGDLITAEMLSLEDWPKDKVPEGALVDLEQVEGRRPKTKIWSGMVILDNQLLKEGESSGAAPRIPVGYRVVSVRVDAESGISNLVRPGDRVDVLLFMKKTRGELAATVTKTIFQDIKVFAVNDLFDIEQAEGQQTFNAKTVSLLVTPHQVEKFTLANEMGQIRLSLRSHEDKETVDLPGALPHELDEEGEESNRLNEELDSKRPGQSDVDSFLAMLNGGGGQSGQEPPQRDIWTTRVVLEGEITEVVMETEAAPEAKDPGNGDSSGLNLWRMISPMRRPSRDAEPEKEEPPAQTAPKSE
jgi:pilus assembly protein CpaB